MIKTTITAVLFMITLWATATAETIYIPLVIGGKTELVHAYNNGRGTALQHGDMLEVHCESGMVTARVYGGVAYVECH